MRAILRKAKERLLGPGIRRNVCGTRHDRDALLMYQVATFHPTARSGAHQNIGQARELARSLAEQGYNVDVVDYDERREKLLGPGYDLVIDLHPVEQPLYQDRLRRGALRIGYITGSNPAFGNAAERERLADLKRRRGVDLKPRRQNPPYPKAVLESLDAVFMIGSTTTLATYAVFHLPSSTLLVNNGYDDVPLTAPERRRSRRFLFLASYGQVHKGLDLLLELFAGEPDLELIVCSQFHKERDFVRAYRRELFATPNIQAVGFVDVRSRAFADLQAECGSMILPSCSEGQSGTVTAAMSYGLPPIVSRECGFDEPDLMMLPDCRPETLRRMVREWAAEPQSLICERSRLALELMRRRYRPAHYAAQVRAGLAEVLGLASRNAVRDTGTAGARR